MNARPNYLNCMSLKTEMYPLSRAIKKKNIISSHIPLNATHWAPDRIRRPPPAFAANQYAEREGWQESAARTVTNTSKLPSRPCSSQE